MLKQGITHLTSLSNEPHTTPPTTSRPEPTPTISLTTPSPFPLNLSPIPTTLMAHHTTHRRNLAAASDPNTSMDPTFKKHPKSTSFTTTTTTTTKPHLPNPDPTLASSTIQTISNHFSKLYTNHKVLASLKASNGKPQPHIDTHLQAKAMAISTISDSSNTSLIKSNFQHRRHVAEVERESARTTAVKGKVKDKNLLKQSHEKHDIKRALVSVKTDGIKKLSKKEREKKEYDEEHDIKRPSVLKSTNQESELKVFDETCEMTRQSVSLAMSGGRRKSFCSSQTELADFFICSGVKIVSVDMAPLMQKHAVDCARKAYDSLEKFTAKTLASTLKKAFDGVFGPAWHCIVGTSFGSFVTHSVGGFLYFSMDHKLHVLLFKTTVQRAE